MPSLSEIRERFQADRFATEAAGAVIESAEPRRAVCSLELQPHHKNANHSPMGGAIFTLADFAFAVAANGCAEQVTVSQHCSISFLSASRGTKLIAEASCLSAGRRTCLYQVDVKDDLGRLIAVATVNGFTVG